MLILGIVLVAAGYLLHVGVVETIGWVLVIIGAILLIMSGMGRPVGGRNYW